MRRPGFTLVELLMVVGVVVVIALVLLPGMNPGCRTHCGSRNLKDATQVRGILQSMVVWAGNNNGCFPVPSELDKADATIAPGTPGAQSKDNTGNILSLLIYTGHISTDICINPAEASTDRVQMDDLYQFDAPGLAARPQRALWDPGFAGTPIDPASARRRKPGVGNQSYAHLLPFGNRLARWSDTGLASAPIFGDRGPEYAGTGAPGRAWKLLDGPTGTGSNTLLIHGPRTSWEGNVAFADGHTAFMTGPAQEGVTYLRAGVQTLDNIFVNEADEDGGDVDGGVMRGVNACLRPVADVSGAPGALTVNLWKD